LPQQPPIADKNGDCGDPDTGAEGKTILDPFCGTGVILQEALLMGYNAYGTDIDDRMTSYAQTNLTWLTRHFPLKHKNFYVEVGDALQADWGSQFDVIAAETYLGRPLSSLPSADKFQEIVRDVDHIHRKFLQNLARQTKTGFRLCIGVPAWKTPRGFMHLPILDQLTDMGYTRISFVHTRSNPLVYHRPDQIVGRELVVLIRK
jgi:tRNA G10  N-methylase Trm11